MKFVLSTSRCLLAVAVVLASAGSAAAQAYGTGESTYDTHKNLTVAVTRFEAARATLKGFISTRAARVQKQEETPSQLIAEFALPARELPRLDSLTAAVGYVLENNLNTHDLSTRQQELHDTELREKSQLALLEQQAKGQLEPDRRLAVQKETEDHTERLGRAHQQLEAIAAHAGQAYVTLRLYDEVSFPTGNRHVSFVNMPGVEYGYLHLDNPKAGLTSPNYQGYSLKYLVTRGKSYLNLGVYKPTTRNDGSAEFVNELFLINFGQDFYPRNFGRGRRKFLNLYTSYQLGSFILNHNNDEANEFIPNLNLGLGVELLKTRHVLLDTKASYFVPLHERSRDLRGVLGQASFNFVF